MDSEAEGTDLTREDVRKMLLEAKAKFGSWDKLAYEMKCKDEKLSNAGLGGYIPLQVAEYFGLERIEIRQIIYRRKK